ncbi:uncharacterized protein [Argopecten irradians]|uniref:uncharacterized protein isoform X2 n=1 Tax=Argopecten irradians TaxID=31199 RepID=UPI00371E1696
MTSQLIRIHKYKVALGSLSSSQKTFIESIEGQDIFVDLDVEGKGFVSQQVFVKEMTKLPRKEAFESAFDMKDFNRDGMLSAKEIQDAFDLVGVDKERSAKFFKQVDTNKDGKISKAEFMKMV